MQETKKINYKGWVLKGTLRTPYKQDAHWGVVVYDKYDVPIRHSVSYIDTWTKRKTSDFFFTYFKGFEDAKYFVDSIEAPSSEMFSNSDCVKKALSECANKFPKGEKYD